MGTFHTEKLLHIVTRRSSYTETLVHTKSLPNATLYHEACIKHFPVLLHTTRLAQSTSQHFFVLQSLHKALPIQSVHKVLPSTTSSHKAYTEKPLQREACTQRSFYTGKPFHREASTHRSFYTQKHLHSSFYTQQAFTHRSFYTLAFTHSKLLHREAFTHSTFVLSTRKPLHKEALSHRRFYTDKLFYTQKLLRAMATEIAAPKQDPGAKRMFLQAAGPSFWAA